MTQKATGRATSSDPVRTQTLSLFEILGGRNTKILLALSLIVPLSIYAVLSSRLINAHVGYEYDEALNVESAVFMLRGGGEPPFAHDAASWVTVSGRRWPLMVIPYIGAIKPYVALPLFVIFGISPEVDRFTGVLLGGLGIVGLVILIGTEISPTAGLVAGVLLAIHPSYLDLTVFDSGAVSSWMAVMGLGALALTSYLRHRSTPRALLLGVAAGVGVWARANMLWLIAAVVVAALFAYGRRAVPTRGHITAIMVGGLCGASPLILYEVSSKLATLRFISNTRQPLSGGKAAHRLYALAELMISDGEHRLIWWGPPLPPWQICIGAALLAIVVLCLFIRIRSDNPATWRWRRAFAMSAAVLTAIMLVSGLGIGQHHLAAVLPLACAAIGILAVEVSRRYRPAIPLLVAAAVGFAVLCLSWDLRIDHGLRRTGGKGYWSTALSDVNEYLTSHPVSPSRLKILNWGFQNNLYVVSGGSVYGSELFWGATKARSPRGLTWESEIRDGGSFLLFLFPTGPSTPSSAAEGFSEALKDYHGPRLEKRFFDRSGSPVALLVEIMPRVSPTPQAIAF